MNALKFFLGSSRNGEVAINNIKQLLLLFSLFLTNEHCLATSVIKDKSFHKKFLKTNSLLEDLYKEIENKPPEKFCDPMEESGNLGSSVKDIRGKDLAITSVTKKKAVEIFNFLASQKDIPFGYPKEGCYARAHKMALLLDEKKITSGKVFLEGNLMIWTKDDPPQLINWGYHTAVILNVEGEGGKLIPYVFDPSLFSKPVPAKEWREVQTKSSAGEIKMYYTKRFNYDLGNSEEDLDDYSKENLRDMEKALKEDMERQRLNEAINSKEVL